MTPHAGPRALSSTYAPRDALLLLDETHAPDLTVEEKERLLQAGLHYGHVVSREAPPSPAQARAFDLALDVSAAVCAHLVDAIAERLVRQYPRGVLLVSLARGGTPLGALLTRALTPRVEAPHVSVSVIRDHGVDQVALGEARAAWPHLPFVIVDGWTGRGRVAREVRASLPGVPLVAAADPAHAADIAGTRDDTLVPWCLLNATVSGLASRSTLPERAGARHRAAFLADLAPFDRTAALLDAVTHHLGQTGVTHAGEAVPRGAPRVTLELAAQWGERDESLVKAGIGESARALLRRDPERLLLRDPEHPTVAPLVLLAQNRDVPVHHVAALPYRAACLVRVRRGDATTKGANAVDAHPPANAVPRRSTP